MSRVSYAMMHPEGAGEMTAAVRKALDGLIATLAMRAGIKRVEILELAIVGNPIMHHLLLGIDPTPLGGAPFALATDRAVRTTTAAELGLRAHPGRPRLRAAVHRRPRRRRHGRRHPGRGAARGRPHDASSSTSARTPRSCSATSAGCSPRRARPARPSRAPRSAAASAPRPAPSSASGSTATTLEPRFRVIGVDAWSDEPDFADGASAETGVTGICGSGIIEVVAELFLAGVVTEDGVIDGALAARTPRVVPDGRTFSYVLHERARTAAARASPSPRTTSGRSSSPRPRCTPASGC